MKNLSLMAAALLLLPASAAAGDAKKPLFEFKGELKSDDKTDPVLTKSFQKTHMVKLEAGKIYRFDLSSKEFDTLLRLENEDGKHLAGDDDSGGGLNSRLVFAVPKDQGGNYRLVATSFKAEATGKYDLNV